MKSLKFAGLMAISAMFTGAASAAVITLDSAPTTFYQQTAASPCVIGGENCLNGGFPYTVAGSGGGGTEFVDIMSPVYSFADIMSKTVFTNFTIGLDYNDTSKDQILREFSMIFCSDAACSSSNGTAQSYFGPTDLKTTNNGVGYSDFLLLGFDLADSNGGDGFVKFQASWFNNDGPDRYFLIAGTDPGTDTPPVPEPSSMFLMGGSLLALAYWRKRKNS